MAFDNLGLADALLEAIGKMGYSEPTPIQARAIPSVLEGRDIVATAQTGTGKTAAFALPILQKLWTPRKGGTPRALILEPTRELAHQVLEAFQNLGSTLQLSITLVHGGVGFGNQKQALHNGTDILIATPGRLLDLQEQGDVKLDEVEFLVLDEADRMLDMGFMPDVRRIVQLTPRTRQTMLFSATLPPEIEHLSAWALKNPVQVAVSTGHSAAETIHHAMLPVDDRQKYELLEYLLKSIDYKSVIIFCRTRFGSDALARWLKEGGHPITVLHSDRTQAERTKALESFKSGATPILVATDIVARGIDISSVSHVINFDIPENPEDYIHRIGRTGRAGHEGDAYTLLTAPDVDFLRAIEGLLGRSIERKKLDGFAYNWTPLDALPVEAKRKRRNS